MTKMVTTNGDNDDNNITKMIAKITTHDKHMTKPMVKKIMTKMITK